MANRWPFPPVIANQFRARQMVAAPREFLHRAGNVCGEAPIALAKDIVERRSCAVTSQHGRPQ